MSINFPRCSWLPLLAFAIAACSSLEQPSRFTGVKAPADAFCQASERLRDEIREYLKDEDRWIPRGRDISLWNSAEMLSASGRNLTGGLTNNKLTPDQLHELVSTATRRLNDLEYWTANVRINDTVQRSLTDVRSSLSAVQRNAKSTPSQEKPRAAVTSTRSRHTTFFPAPEPFSPNDLNGAVQIGKTYLEKKYGIKREAFGNMRAREFSNHHEVTLETRTTRYLLTVDIRKGMVVSEKSLPKPARPLTASR